MAASSTAATRRSNIGRPASICSSPRSSIGTRSTWMPPPSIYDQHRSRCLMIYRSEEHTSELQSLMRISYAVSCLKKKITASKPRQNLPALPPLLPISYHSSLHTPHSTHASHQPHHRRI